MSFTKFTRNNFYLDNRFRYSLLRRRQRWLMNIRLLSILRKGNVMKGG